LFFFSASKLANINSKNAISWWASTKPSQPTIHRHSLKTQGRVARKVVHKWRATQDISKKSQQPNLRISFAIINFQNFYLLFFFLMLYLLFRFWRKSFFFVLLQNAETWSGWKRIFNANYEVLNSQFFSVLFLDFSEKGLQENQEVK